MNHQARLRQMYRGGVGNASARRWARLWASVFARAPIGIRWVTLEVPGRKSGRPTRFPLGMADLDGRWFLVSMLGECNWVRNVRANDGQALLIRAGWAVSVTLREVPAVDRPRIVQRYLRKVPGGRPHIPVDKNAPLKEYAAVARLPVFLVEGVTPVRSRACRRR